jgi:hypothetical protein
VGLLDNSEHRLWYWKIDIIDWGAHATLVISTQCDRLKESRWSEASEPTAIVSAKSRS